MRNGDNQLTMRVPLVLWRTPSCLPFNRDPFEIHGVEAIWAGLESTGVALDNCDSASSRRLLFFEEARVPQRLTPK